MAHAEILNICAFTNADFSDISPENRLKPDRRFPANLHISYNLRTRCYKNGVVDVRHNAFI
jgi:hypothetical protein